MIRRITEEPRKWTPILSAISAIGTTFFTILISIVGWFLLRTLTQIDDSIKIQTNKLEVIVDRFHEKEIVTENRLGKVESEVKFLDTRVDRIERTKQIAMQ